MCNREKARRGIWGSACLSGPKQLSKSPQNERTEASGNAGGHFLAGVLKEAAEARKGRPHPVTRG